MAENYIEFACLVNIKILFLLCRHFESNSSCQNDNQLHLPNDKHVYMLGYLYYNKSVIWYNKLKYSVNVHFHRYDLIHKLEMTIHIDIIWYIFIFLPLFRHHIKQKINVYKLSYISFFIPLLTLNVIWKIIK